MTPKESTGATAHKRQAASDVSGRVARVSHWLVHRGRFVANNRELFEKFCELVAESGVPLARSWLHIRTLHPEFAGMSRIWRRGMAIEERILEFGFEKTPAYLKSPVRQTVEGRELMSWRLDPGAALPFPVLDELRAAGYTHYVVGPLLFSEGRANAVSWATDEPSGFSDGDLQFFREILPTLAAVVEIKSLRRFVVNVLSTYVGHEPGELILKGQIRRGDVRTITAALMIVDLRDFTSLSDTLTPPRVIETLNHYFDCVIPPIHRHGGEVMEIMGDGVLAIFKEDGERTAHEACRLAFAAAREGLAALASPAPGAATAPLQLTAGFALHHGQVSYGNIGAGDRLDFTVVGPDVNLTSRIERLCRELDRSLIMSGEFVSFLDVPVVEIGHFRLRGFPGMKILYGMEQ